MQLGSRSWDYLIVTASNEAQATAYEAQLAVRRELGLLSSVCETIVVADPGGKRVGSGGSTLFCLLEVLQRRLGRQMAKSGPPLWLETLSGMRILVVHAGGDSRRLPAYGPCGKIFIPVPGENDSAVCLSLFDRQLPTYLALPEPTQGQGQVVIASGDVLLRFDPSDIRLTRQGITALACYANPEQASRHGVFCQGSDDAVRLYLQKPSISEQRAHGAINAYGQTCLDIGVMHFDAATAVRLLQVFGARPNSAGGAALAGRRGKAVLERGLDFYREVCCTMGTHGRLASYIKSARGSGSKWSDAMLTELFGLLSDTPFSVQLLKHCDFLDFGSSRAILTNGTRLLQEDRGISFLQTYLDINNEVAPSATVQGTGGWVEGCRIASSLTLGGSNVVVGADIDQPLVLPAGACVDVIEGRSRDAGYIWFVRCYGIDDAFKEPAGQGAVFCGKDLLVWLADVGAAPQDVWDRRTAKKDRSIWNARLFPAVKAHGDYHRWLWMFEPNAASEEQRNAWRTADRYSFEQILALADHVAFHRRRSRIRAQHIRASWRQVFRPDSGFSSQELAHVLGDGTDASASIAGILTEAHRYYDSREDRGMASLVGPRILHTLGTALTALHADTETPADPVLGNVEDGLTRAQCEWLRSLGLLPQRDITLKQWSHRAQQAAFEALERSIVGSGIVETTSPRSVLRSDEIVWARAPARLDVGGGWTDTPPYALERGGCVVNAAVNLNGQPPIQAYVRVIDEPVIRIGSIDLGVRIEIQRFEDLLDYRKATGSFALAKAALVLSGLSPRQGGRSKAVSLKKALDAFGGGIELTTLAAIPKGSGLGTSSIMGAVISAALARVIGKDLSQRELFHQVLRLEQALTTGGGWQDQIGGVVDGVKMIVAQPGMVPDAHIHYVPADIIDPMFNHQSTLLYYTGITRLAKNILQQVVGRYLNRDRATMATLAHIGQTAREVMDAFIRKDAARFGRLVDTAWQLNKQLDPNSSNDEIEALLARVRPHMHGAKLLGAGGGGFLLMVCKSRQDAETVRHMLEAEPPNERARFFDYSVSHEGLVVTVS
ncbi:fucose pyrophosphorylase domain-containing protein [Anaerobaca lacustris]|uniref:L-fucokinase n=1 Tax=Anaerobaca lacustris TaxID=3044600 RepID=A0AAW6TZG5_9BACT|nr:L-fucokinase [Sedimentisphaerales bacterium M17dextr]